MLIQSLYQQGLQQAQASLLSWALLRAHADCFPELIPAAMQRILIAAIGPVTAEAVEKAGWPVGAMPEDSFHLKPLVTASGRKLAEASEVSPPA